jgi:protein-L-isoaspartate(D-aspartate) O-methyltransferase
MLGKKKMGQTIITLSKSFTSVSAIMGNNNNINSNDKLVDYLISQGIIKSKFVEYAIRNTDRGIYCETCSTTGNHNDENKINLEEAYEDHPLSIGWGATISAPHMHAMAMELLLNHNLIKKKDKDKDASFRVLDIGCGSGYLVSCFHRLLTNISEPGVKNIVVGVDYVPELVKLSSRNIAKDDENLLKSGSVVLECGDGWQGFEHHDNTISKHRLFGVRYVPLVPQSKPTNFL